jgi:Ni2+-binding GTPase involved in maturation of urease and hydrogenase
MIDVVLFAGFLGAGKTTLLGRLLPSLAASRRTALLVNDFGKLAIDAALLHRHGVPMKEIAGGSIFCVCKQADLLRQLTDIATEIRPELLLVEASGLAEPTDTAALLQSTFLREMYARPKVVTVVDAVNFPRLSRGLRVLGRQVEVADVLVVAKADLADTAPVEKLLRELNPSARIVLSDLQGLRGAIDWRSEGRVEADAPARLCATATPGFSTVNLAGAGADAGAIAFDELNALLDEFRGVLLRGKGVLRGRCLELVNGTYTWTEDAPGDLGEGLFFALKGDAAAAFEARLRALGTDS